VGEGAKRTRRPASVVEGGLKVGDITKGGVLMVRAEEM
jgi:hypothetical protein